MDEMNLDRFIDRFKQLRVAVLGDLMLDVYIRGDAKRLSPEAPVPVLDVTGISSCLGGAGNVMRNLVTLGGRSMAFGMIGNDDAGRRMLEELRGYGIASEGVLRDAARRTTEKQRILSGHQQLLRLDYEDTYPASGPIREKLVEQILHLIRDREIDALIFEDYRKGLLDSSMLGAIVPEAVQNGVITALDPKPGNLEPVKGLTIIKPNRAEALSMSGLTALHGEPPSLEQIASTLLHQWQPEHLLISLAQDGLALFNGSGKKTFIPTRAKEVFDVSGAGDTVIATVTMAMAAGASPEAAAELGNYAAGIVVGKVGTATVSEAELRQEIKLRNYL